MVTAALGGFPSGSDGKESARNTGGMGLISGSGRYPEEGYGYPLQYSRLEHSWVEETDRLPVQQAGCPRGHKELDMTEGLTLHFIHL